MFNFVCVAYMQYAVCSDALTLSRHSINIRADVVDGSEQGAMPEAQVKQGPCVLCMCPTSDMAHGLQLCFNPLLFTLLFTPHPIMFGEVGSLLRSASGCGCRHTSAELRAVELVLIIVPADGAVRTAQCLPFSRAHAVLCLRPTSEVSYCLQPCFIPLLSFYTSTPIGLLGLLAFAGFCGVLRFACGWYALHSCATR
jgi:hypothetical protein